MGRKPDLTAENLVALGAEKLATLVLDGAARDPTFRKLVVGALAAAKGVDAVLALVERRIEALEGAKAPVAWDKRKGLRDDLDAHVTIVLRDLAPLAPRAAFVQILRFVATAKVTVERFGEGAADIEPIYDRAIDAISLIAAEIGDLDTIGLGECLVDMVSELGDPATCKLFNELVPFMAPDVRRRIDASFELVDRALSGGKKTAPWDQNRLAILRARQSLADGDGDAERFAELDASLPVNLRDSAAVAERFLQTGRADEASKRLGLGPTEAPTPRSRGHDRSPPRAGAGADPRRVGVEIRVLEALGQDGAAQARRWGAFEQSLEPALLRDILLHLSDLDAAGALSRGLGLAAACPDPYRALSFFVAWPRHDLAAKLVFERRDVWDGKRWDLLPGLAEALEEAEPAAAALLYRILIEHILEFNRSKAFFYGANYLLKLDAMQDRTHAVPNLLGHALWRAELRRTYGHLQPFWAMVYARGRAAEADALS